MVDSIFVQRRAALLEAMGKGVLVLFAAGAAIRNNDVEHEYRQDSDLYYLTGFDEPESVLVLSTVHADRYVLFVRPRDPEREVWDGSRVGVDGATAEFGASAAFPIAELEQKLPDWLENCERLFYRRGRDRAQDDQLLKAIERTRPRARRGSSFPTQ